MRVARLANGTPAVRPPTLFDANGVHTHEAAHRCAPPSVRELLGKTCRHEKINVQILPRVIWSMRRKSLTRNTMCQAQMLLMDSGSAPARSSILL